MIKAIRKQKKAAAIQGRRNRCHALGPIIQYHEFDMAACAAANKILKEYSRGCGLTMPIESSFRLTFPDRKKPRILDRDQWDFLQGMVMGLEDRVTKLQAELKKKREVTINMDRLMNAGTNFSGMPGEAKVAEILLRILKSASEI